METGEMIEPKAMQDYQCNIDLLGKIKHPMCVKKVIAELEDGREIKAELMRPEGLVAYRIEYKEGPCRTMCDILDKEIQSQGCYNGRVDRITLKDIQS